MLKVLKEKQGLSKILHVGKGAWQDTYHSMWDLTCLLPTGSEEREVLGVGSIPVAILPSCQYMKILHYNCTDMNIPG